MDTKTIQKYDNEFLLHSWCVQSKNPRKVIEKAEGIYLYDSEGQRYMDFSSQSVNVNIGHGNAKVVAAIQKAATELPALGPAYANESRSKLAKRVVELCSDNMAKVFFTLSGAESNENAIKIARMYTGRRKVMSRYRSYHGSTNGAGNLTGEPRRIPNEIAGSTGYVKFFDPYYYQDHLSEEEATEFYLRKLREQIIYEGPETIAAIFMETITGTNGVLIPPKGYLPGVRKICDEFGILMVCDEVMVGFGRTGKYFAFQNFDVKPDIVTFAKGITCGYVPLGGVIVDKKISDYFDTHMFSCGLTYTAHVLACSTGLATLDVYEEEGLIQNSAALGKVMLEKLNIMKEKHPSVGDIRCKGLFAAIELVKDKESREPLVPYGKDPEGIMGKVIGKIAEEKVVMFSHENSLIIAPPLCINEEQLCEGLEIIDNAISIVDEFIGNQTRK